MKFSEFERVAAEAFESGPEHFREGIDGLVVSRESVAHPTMPDIWTLGHCETESYPSGWTGPDTTRSVVVLYYGSFRNLARQDSDFDWEAEIYETVEHEIKHHLESLADEDQLGDVDYALDEDFKRDEGLDWDPWYYQKGDASEPGVFAVEDRVFIEQLWSSGDFDKAEEIHFSWAGREYRIARPETLGDVQYVLLHGVDKPPAVLELVLVRRRTWWEDVKRLVGASRPVVIESDADAEPVGR